jgi:hypothetical protein
MSRRERAPRIDLAPVLLGVALALALALIATGIGLGLAGELVAVAVGGWLAGRRAPEAPLLHGALVGGAWILVFTALPTRDGQAPDLLADTVATLAADTTYMCAAAAGAFVGGRARKGLR